MPFAIVVVLALVLGVAAVAFDSSAEERAAAPRPAPFEQVVARVERERGLKFERVLRPVVVSPEEALAEGMESFDEDYPPARRRADTDMLVMLGLLPPGTDLLATFESTLTEQVSGYYDPRKQRLRIVSGAQTANRVLYEMTLAHELNHALEDQAFDFDLSAMAEGGDRGLAVTAMIEGTATVMMYRYVDERFEEQELLAGVAASAFAGLGDLPPFIMAQLTFPYVAGELFINRLLKVGNGGWAVVDAAERHRPPESTEQILHPGKYLRVEQPEQVSLRGPELALGDGWRRLIVSTFGEWQTQKLLARAGGTGSGRAAAGWGGDRYALFGRGDDRVLLMRWTWDTERDEAEFVEALRAWGDGGLPGSTPAGADAWSTPDGAAAFARRSGAVTLVLAPDAELARAVARAE